MPKQYFYVSFKGNKKWPLWVIDYYLLGVLQVRKTFPGGQPQITLNLKMFDKYRYLFHFLLYKNLTTAALATCDSDLTFTFLLSPLSDPKQLWAIAHLKYPNSRHFLALAKRTSIYNFHKIIWVFINFN